MNNKALLKVLENLQRRSQQKREEYLFNSYVYAIKKTANTLNLDMEYPLSAYFSFSVQSEF